MLVQALAVGLESSSGNAALGNLLVMRKRTPAE
jgi:hypothetical protein